jgi:hypothetical protein
MGGNACHHCGEFRPSKYLPLPDSIVPNPFELEHEHGKSSKSSKPCPGALFDDLLPGRDRTKPFYEISNLPDGKGIAHDWAEATNTIAKVQECDAREEVLVVMTHDDSLLGVLEFFPSEANMFVEKGWVTEGR